MKKKRNSRNVISKIEKEHEERKQQQFEKQQEEQRMRNNIYDMKELLKAIRRVTEVMHVFQQVKLALLDIQEMITCNLFYNANCECLLTSAHK